MSWEQQVIDGLVARVERQQAWLALAMLAIVFLLACVVALPLLVAWEDRERERNRLELEP